jgi:drug/metabolite transporter (DMT)-like permease
LQYSAPLYILILGPKLLGEANRPRDFALMAVLATGILLLFFGQQAAVGTAPDPAVGNMFGLAAGVTWALTIMGLRWLALQPGVTNASGTAVVAGNAIACLVCLPMAFPLNEPTLVDWGIVVYLGVVQTSLAYVCLLRGLDHLRTIQATLLLLIEPVAASIWAWLVHGEVMGSTALLGGMLIFAAVVFEAVQSSDDEVTSLGEQTE